MTRQHWWVVAILAVLAVGGTFLASVLTYVPDEPAASSPPTAEATEQGDSVTDATTLVTIAGTLTPLSTSSTPGFFLLRIMGEGYLPVQMGDHSGSSGFTTTLVLEVPGEFVPAEDRAELFAQLRDIASTTSEPFTVVEVVR